MENSLIFIKYRHLLLALIFSQYSLIVLCEEYSAYSNASRELKRTLAKKEGFFTNTWAVELEQPGEEHVLDIAKRNGFSIIGKVSNTFLCRKSRRVRELSISSF